LKEKKGEMKQSEGLPRQRLIREKKKKERMEEKK
jgi:hypothetical protein